MLPCVISRRNLSAAAWPKLRTHKCHWSNSTRLSPSCENAVKGGFCNFSNVPKLLEWFFQAWCFSEHCQDKQTRPPKSEAPSPPQQQHPARILDFHGISESHIQSPGVSGGIFISLNSLGIIWITWVLRNSTTC